MKELSTFFATQRRYRHFQALQQGDVADRKLYEEMYRAIRTLTQNSRAGIKVGKALWPREYKKYLITNLWKYDLPNGWRMSYTIQETNSASMVIIFEWLSHNEYERRFKY